jgi:molybdopterin/thiamine biosynthesis adenylyltransferase
LDYPHPLQAISDRFPSERAKEALSRVDVVMGCVDRDGARFLLNEFCCEHGLPLVDAASDTLLSS